MLPRESVTTTAPMPVAYFTHSRCASLSRFAHRANPYRKDSLSEGSRATFPLPASGFTGFARESLASPFHLQCIYLAAEICALACASARKRGAFPLPFPSLGCSFHLQCIYLAAEITQWPLPAGPEKGARQNRRASFAAPRILRQRRRITFGRLNAMRAIRSGFSRT